MIRESGLYLIKWGKFEKYALDIAYFDYSEDFPDIPGKWRIVGEDYNIDERHFSYISPKPIDLNKIFEILNNGNESYIT